ncbi:MAG: hypothetical protein K2O57_07330, partial [Acetatifactor sp.]|nr:hypothetical protein [Acetatifactor sp.]
LYQRFSSITQIVLSDKKTGKNKKKLPTFFSHKKFFAAHTKTKISDELSWPILKIEKKKKNKKTKMYLEVKHKWQAEAIE